MGWWDEQGFLSADVSDPIAVFRGWLAEAESDGDK